MERIPFLNIFIDNCTMEEAINRIDFLIIQRKNSIVVTPNVDAIINLQKNQEYKAAYDKADLILTDGFPILWLSKKYATPIKEKISGVDLFPKVCELAEKKAYSVFLLGAKKDVAEMAKKNLIAKYPKLKIVGNFSPDLGFEKNQKSVDEVISLVNLAKPDILIVCLGAPKQEIFMNKYRERLNVPISFGLGATLDFMAGVVRRAPKWMQNHGLEWLFRLTQEPKRLFKRYFSDLRIFSLTRHYYSKRKKNEAKHHK